MEEFYAEWNPKDFVLISTHEARKHIHKKLEEIHTEKFPDELRRIRYTDKCKAKAGEIDYIPL